MSEFLPCSLHAPCVNLHWHTVGRRVRRILCPLDALFANYTGQKTEQSEILQILITEIFLINRRYFEL